MRILILALLLCSCGPPPAPHGRYHGEILDHTGQPHTGTVEITPTAPDRVHLHLDYGHLCDGDGALALGDMIFPDGGGEILIEPNSLKGNFFSAIGNEYHIDVSPEGAQ